MLGTGAAGSLVPPAPLVAVAVEVGTETGEGETGKGETVVEDVVGSGSAPVGALSDVGATDVETGVGAPGAVGALDDTGVSVLLGTQTAFGAPHSPATWSPPDWVAQPENNTSKTVATRITTLEDAASRVFDRPEWTVCRQKADS